MASLLDMVQQHLGAGEIGQISQQLGTNESTTQKAVSAALPMLLGGMADKASQPGGADDIHQALESHTGVLGNLSGLLGAAPLADSGSGMLGRILGGKQEPVKRAVSQSSGLDVGQTTRLLALLAPVVLGVLAHKKHEEGMDTGQLSSTLQHARQSAHEQARQHAPNAGDLLGEIFGGR